MGERLGKTYSALWQQVTQINLIWNEYRLIYGTKESRVEIINKVAQVFNLTQDALFDHIVLHIVRLSDKIKSRKGNNHLTTNLLIDEVDSSIKKM
jgi:hypothetical protein